MHVNTSWIRVVSFLLKGPFHSYTVDAPEVMSVDFIVQVYCVTCMYCLKVT